MLLFETIVLAAWVGCFVTTLLNVALIPRLRPVESARGDGPAPAAALPGVSVIVPARNEQRTIESAVSALLAQTYAPLEVIVVDDRSTDGTRAILDRLASADSRLVVVAGEEPPPGWLGKPWALHQGSRRAGGDLLLFVDADIHYAPQTVATLVQRLETRAVAMVAILPRFEMHGFWEAVALSQLPVAALTNLPVWLGNFTSLVELGIGGGPGNLVRRSAFEEMGGYESLKNAVIDDIGMARQIRSHGHRTDIVLGDRLASVRMYHGAGEVIEGFTKNVFPMLGGSVLATLMLVLMMLAVQLAPYLLALRGDRLAILTISVITLTRFVLFTRLEYRIDVALVGAPLTAIVWTWIMLRSAWMVGVRRQLHWRGRVYERNWTRFGTKRGRSR